MNIGITTEQISVSKDTYYRNSITTFYKDYLSRPPDIGGMGWYLRMIHEGWTLDKVKNDIAGSVNAHLVPIYNNLLKRLPHYPQETDYYKDKFERESWTYPQIEMDIKLSDEYKTIYSTAFGREYISTASLIELDKIWLYTIQGNYGNATYMNVEKYLKMNYPDIRDGAINYVKSQAQTILLNNTNTPLTKIDVVAMFDIIQNPSKYGVQKNAVTDALRTNPRWRGNSNTQLYSCILSYATYSKEIDYNSIMSGFNVRPPEPPQPPPPPPPPSVITPIIITQPKIETSKPIELPITIQDLIKPEIGVALPSFVEPEPPYYPEKHNPYIGDNPLIIKEKEPEQLTATDKKILPKEPVEIKPVEAGFGINKNNIGYILGIALPLIIIGMIFSRKKGV